MAVAEDEDEDYFRGYGAMDAQMNMVMDGARTGAYNLAVRKAQCYLRDRVVLDVGSGTGILSVMCARVGAQVVYAVEASAAFRILTRVALQAGDNRIVPLHAMIENVHVVESMEPGHAAAYSTLYAAACKEEKRRKLNYSDESFNISPVDVLISEPMGMCLLHEGMMDTYLAARDQLLKPEKVVNGVKHYPVGSMFPDKATLHVGLSSSTYFIKYVVQETALWRQRNYWGIDWTCLHEDAVNEILSRPVVLSSGDVVREDSVGRLDKQGSLSLEEEELPFRRGERVCSDDETSETRTQSDTKGATPVSGSVRFDLLTCSRSDLEECKTSFQVGPFTGDTMLTAFAVWFDVTFPLGVQFTTSPDSEDTHWHQTFFLLRVPFMLERGGILHAQFLMEKSSRTYICQGHLLRDGVVVASTLKCSLDDNVQV